jgi:predicted alpha/beta-fold hydrolase
VSRAIQFIDATLPEVRWTVLQGTHAHQGHDQDQASLVVFCPGIAKHPGHPKTSRTSKVIPDDGGLLLLARACIQCGWRVVICEPMLSTLQFACAVAAIQTKYHAPMAAVGTGTGGDIVIAHMGREHHECVGMSASEPLKAGVAISASWKSPVRTCMINAPLLCLAAWDDPCHPCPPSSTFHAQVASQRNPHIIAVSTERGGHAAWLAEPTPRLASSGLLEVSTWLEKVVLPFLGCVLD